MQLKRGKSWKGYRGKTYRIFRDFLRERGIHETRCRQCANIAADCLLDAHHKARSGRDLSRYIGIATKVMMRRLAAEVR